MLLQRGGTGTIAPPGFCAPPWDARAASWDTGPMPANSTVSLGPATIHLGHDDLEAEDTVPEKGETALTHEFGWDNERPKREVHIDKFRIEWGPSRTNSSTSSSMEQAKAWCSSPPAGSK